MNKPALLLAAAAALLAVSPVHARPMTATDMHSMHRIGAPEVSPDGKKREIVCTGIRFPIGLAFNRHGDLFCTDQEGATWLPGGNPLDELNQIIPGKHYGFPQRNEKYLPNVTDDFITPFQLAQARQ